MPRLDLWVRCGIMLRMAGRNRRERIRLFEVARRHLSDARDRAEDLRSIWNNREAGHFSADILMDDDGNGEIFVTFSPPSEVRDQLENAAAEFCALLKHAMDAAVLETASIVCAVFGDMDETTHHMPLFSDPAIFDLLVPHTMLQGLRPDQVRVIREFQPFSHGDRARDMIGKHMRQLANALRPERSDPRVAVWASGSQLEFRLPAIVSIRDLAVEPDGPFVESRRLATFSTEPPATRRNVAFNPNVAFDLILNDAPWPDNPDDDLGSRLRTMCLLVGHLIDALERSVTTPPLLQRIGSLDHGFPAEPSSSWLPVHFDNPQDQQAALDSIRQSNMGLATHRGPQGTFTLLRMLDGALVGRRFGEASIPDSTRVYGAAVEHASLRAAAEWGLPDFVFVPRAVDKGSGIREVGDGTIVSGGRGLAIQVKARETATSDPNRERSWLIKKSAHGVRQARGTIRTSLTSGFHGADVS